MTNLVSRSPWNRANWDKPSVAVLPFTATESSDIPLYLCDGIVEELISNLARFRDLHVIARNSSFIYRHQQLPHSKIGEELNVKFLVEGSLTQRDNLIVASVQLVEAQSGIVIWSDQFAESIETLSSL